MSKRFLVAAFSAVALMATAACGGADSTSSKDGDVTVALPFASCLAWYPFYVALEKGYFKDSGVAAKFEATDGSGGAIQATLSGKADIAVSAPNNYLSAAASGAQLVGYYGLYQRSTFALVTPEDSGITTLSDLKGKKVGISGPGGGDVVYMEALMKQGADLTANKDFTELAVGDGSAAATALKKKVVSAYSAAFFDAEVIKAGGIKLRTLTTDSQAEVVDSIFVSTNKWATSNSDTIDKFGNAVARGTTWGLENPDGVIKLCGKYAPEETQDKAFARVIYDRVSTLLTLPATSDGNYGQIDLKALSSYGDLLATLKLIKSAEGLSNLTNSHVAAWNAAGTS